MELMIYVGLTAMVVGLFGAILVTILRVQGEQNSSSQVSSELNTLMTTIKRHIHETYSFTAVEQHQLDLIKNPSEGLMQAFSIVYIPADGIINITDGSMPPETATEQISSNRTNIDDLTFEKIYDPANPDSLAIRISITASANTTDPARMSTRTLQATASPFLQSQ